MKSLVTGGLGFVGSRIVDALLKRGEKVRVLSLPLPRCEGVDWGRCETILGDIRDPGLVRRAVSGCNRVFHVAGYAKNWARDPGVYVRTNVEGTRAVLQAALEGGIERVVYTSSNLSLGPSNGTPVDEAQFRNSDFFTDYERSKSVAESVVRSFVRNGLDVVIVNPTRIYGPGPINEANSVTKMIVWYLQGKWRVIPGDGRAVGNYVHIDDVVLGHLLAMDKGRAGENYILGGENASFDDFFRELTRISGKRFRLFHLPDAVALLFANFELARSRWLDHYPLITPGWTKTFLVSWENSCEKAGHELGYCPAPLAAGMKQTVDWLLSEKIV